MLDHLNVAPGETVLHLGCGTGCPSAILAQLVEHVPDGRCWALGDGYCLSWCDPECAPA